MDYFRSLPTYYNQRTQQHISINKTHMYQLDFKANPRIPASLNPRQKRLVVQFQQQIDQNLVLLTHYIQQAKYDKAIAMSQQTIDFIKVNEVIKNTEKNYEISQMLLAQYGVYAHTRQFIQAQQVYRQLSGCIRFLTNRQKYEINLEIIIYSFQLNNYELVMSIFYEQQHSDPDIQFLMLYYVATIYYYQYDYKVAYAHFLTALHVAKQHVVLPVQIYSLEEIIQDDGLWISKVGYQNISTIFPLADKPSMIADLLVVLGKLMNRQNYENIGTKLHRIAKHVVNDEGNRILVDGFEQIDDTIRIEQSLQLQTSRDLVHSTVQSVQKRRRGNYLERSDIQNLQSQLKFE